MAKQENDKFKENVSEQEMNETQECMQEKDTANAEENVGESTEDAPENVSSSEEKDPLAAAQQQIEDLKTQLLYKQAEFDNFRKRTMKEKAELILGGGEKTIASILPVLDDFERAIADKSEDPNAVREGMQLIYNKFVKILEQQGVKKIETANVDFDVDYHEAIAMVPGMGEDKVGKVIDCVQTGYILNDKVIRHAKVAVGQ